MRASRKVAALAAVIVAGAAACSASNGDGSRFGGAGAGGSSGGGGIGGSGGGIDFDASHPSDSGTGPDGCLTTTSKSNRLPANLMFQLDVSGSMNCLPTEDPNVSSNCPTSDKPGSRWRLLRDALKTALGNIPTDNAAGLMHFPLPAATLGICVPATPDVALAPLSTNLAALRSTLDAMTPVGGTPTHDAAAAAYSALKASSAAGNKFIVLATDGQANYCQGCNPLCDLNADAAAFVQQIGDAARLEGIRTFVIGVPGSEGYRAVLSQLAEAGGTAQPGCHSGDIVQSPTVGDCHWDMTTQAADFGAAIATALAAISGQALSCSYDVPPADAGTFDKNLVNVQFTEGGGSTEIPFDPTGQNGWNYSADGSHVELFGAACDAVKASQDGQVDIVYGCPTRGPQ